MNSEQTARQNPLFAPKVDPALFRLLEKMDAGVADTFTKEQLHELSGAVKVQRWGKHPIDLRPTLVFPFLPWNFYMVFLAGRNKRHLSSSEQVIAAGMLMLVLVFMGLTVFGFIVILLYLLKSALGIDFFPEQSLGIWDEFKKLFD